MKPKKLASLFAIIAILGVAVFLQKTAERRAPAPAATEERILKSVSPAFVKRIEIKQTGATTISLLKNASGEWTIETRYGAPARKESVEEFLKAFSDLRGELRAASEAVLADFRIDEKQGIRLEFLGESGSSLSAVFLSPLRPTAVHNFVRDAAASEVILVKKDLLGILGLWKEDAKLDYKTFADRRVIRFDAAKVTRLEVPSEGKPITMTRSEKNWVFEPAGEPVDDSKVSQYLAQISNLYAMDVLDPKTDHGLASVPAIRFIEKTDAGERTLSIKVTPADAEKKAILETLPDGRVYSVSEERISFLKKKKSDFIAAKPA